MLLVVVIAAGTISLCFHSVLILRFIAFASLILRFIAFASLMLGFIAFAPLRAVRAGRMHGAPVVPVIWGWMLVTLLMPLGAVVVRSIVVLSACVT